MPDKNIRIYNEDTDQWFVVTLQYTIANSYLFWSDGSPR